MKTPTTLAHPIAVGLLAGAVGALLAASVLNDGPEAATLVRTSSDVDPSAIAARFDAIDATLARLDRHLTGLELVGDAAQRAPLGDRVTRSEVGKLVADALGAATRATPPQDSDASLPRNERGMHPDLQLVAFEDGSGNAVANAPGRVEKRRGGSYELREQLRAAVLEDQSNQFATWLGLVPAQRESMLGALYDQEARRDEIRRLANEGADLDYQAQLKGENTEAFHLALATFLTAEQLARFKSVGGSSEIQFWAF
jgi:hypothetical protein